MTVGKQFYAIISSDLNFNLPLNIGLNIPFEMQYALSYLSDDYEFSYNGIENTR